MIRRRLPAVSLLLTLTLILLAGCGTGGAKGIDTAGSGSQEGESGSKAIIPVRLVEAWYSKGEDGGYFAALQQGYYKDAGIDMSIQPGGPQVSGLQMVAAGQADFGISYGDEILKAREEGIPVVGLLAAFQYTPQVFMFHKGENITDFKDMNGRAVYTTPGALYWEFIKKQYKLDKVKEFAYTGQLANFINDSKSLNQGYITNEPYALQQENVDVSFLKVKDSGYANYADVLFTTEKFIKEHPDVVAAVVQATQKGWGYYNENYKTVNPFIQTYNKDMPTAAMDYEAEHQKEFIVTDETKSNGIGYMTKDRWQKIMEQMTDMGVLTKPQDAEKAFTTEFLKK
ncbi:ABC transporter substrate-binding protein [Paenibacillus pinihumi]|uniref:ABC transporter substrate-binding protein n=1 Tax=Paenibacillus pinihumi TaxID=669462 RepID=UPI0003FF455E|nr:ABC transporter substrate-binding protein [Paenibacillus pinihumi]